jgi:hypothetical protein
MDRSVRLVERRTRSRLSAAVAADRANRFRGGVSCAGGNGGDYAKVSNITLTAGASVAYAVGAGGTAGVGTGGTSTSGLATAGGDTFFGNASYASATVAAKGGQVGTSNSYTAAAAQDAATNGIGTTKYSGGRGGAPGAAFDFSMGGGGGAAGPSGAGGNGAVSTTAVGVAGGSANNGATAGGAGAATNAAPGSDGSAAALWTATAGGTAGPGSGGGTGCSTGAGSAGGNGGTYGGGGAGAGTGSGQKSGGAGRQGIIVITYTPGSPTPTPSASVRRGRMGLGGLGLPGLSGGYVGGTTGMTPTPSPTPGATHNGPTPAASTTNMATGYGNLISKLDALSPAGGGTITLQGPAGGSAAGAYQVGGVGTSLDLSGYSFASPVTIRAADFSDKPIFRGTNGSGGWIGVPDNVIIDGWQIEDTQATDSVQDIIYYPGGQTIVSNVFRRCYVKGTILSSSSPTYGTTSGQRFVDSRGKSNITVEYCVFHAIQTGFYVDANGGSNIFRYNSVLHWGDHAVKGGGSFNGLVIQNNLFQAPLPGYSAAPNYYNHGNAIYFAGGSSAVGTGLDVNGNFFYSVVDHSHARFLAVSWEDIIAPSVTSPSPTAWTNMQVRNNKTRGGTSNVITINGVTGTGNSVTGNDVRTCSDSVGCGRCPGGTEAVGGWR